eukprot:TRINITY_DN9260_c4_g1_i2.p1 TRINITY_DN9260_c4_g1~~TRINITY_DN9260_c4_g1_i2.p1  ORF type:complete len:382 (-),score=31.85 TRINITY_DN9260_c4_g1_i2:178-1323(-)
MKSAGLAGGLLLLGLVYTLSLLSMGLLVLLSSQQGIFTYKAFAEKFIGSAWSTVVELWVFFYNIGICISYPILLGDFLYALAVQCGYGSFTSKKELMCIVVGCVCWPLSCAPSLGGLRHMSTVGCICIFFCAVAVTKRFVDGSYKVPGDPEADMVAFNFSTFGNCFPILVGAFGAHYNIPALYHEVAPGAGPRDYHKTAAGKVAMRKMKRVLFYAVTISGVVYAWVGLAVYATFGNHTLSDFSQNFRHNDIWFVCVRATTSCAICASFPLVMVSARSAAFSILLQPRGWEMTRQLRLFLSTALTALVLGIAVAADNVGVVLAYNGSVFGTPVCFIAPAVMYLWGVPRERRRVTWTSAALFCAVAGVVFALLGVVSVSTTKH